MKIEHLKELLPTLKGLISQEMTPEEVNYMKGNNDCINRIIRLIET